MYQKSIITLIMQYALVRYVALSGQKDQNRTICRLCVDSQKHHVAFSQHEMMQKGNRRYRPTYSFRAITVNHCMSNYCCNEQFHTPLKRLLLVMPGVAESLITLHSLMGNVAITTITREWARVRKGWACPTRHQVPVVTLQTERG